MKTTYEVYVFPSFLGRQGTTLGSLKETFDNEPDARSYCRLMSSKQFYKYSIQMVTKEWLE